MVSSDWEDDPDFDESESSMSWFAWIEWRVSSYWAFEGKFVPLMVI